MNVTEKESSKEIEHYLQKDIFIWDIGIYEMYIGSVTWVFQNGSSNLKEEKNKTVKEKKTEVK